MYDRKIQILAHVNGDAAIDQFISAVALSKRNSKPITKGGFSNLDNLRTVSIHSQMATIENLNKMMSLKIIPSFFGEHTFYWGDWHRDETIGPERAVHISPAASARSKKMLFT
jgi:predicted amidohydrolase YtcJ